MTSGSPPASTVSTYWGAAKPGRRVPLDAAVASAAPTTSAVASSASLRVRFTWCLLPLRAHREEDPAAGGNLQAGQPSVRGEQRPDELVERLAIAARDDGRRERTDRRRAWDVHGQRDLAEVVAGP